MPCLTPMNLRTRSSFKGSGGRRERQRGAATLIVVMVLFFVMSLAAAYASRNLIFEQRTSANQYRSTQSFEAAEAGIEWALAMLNGGRIAADCTPTADTTQNSFRQRYVVTDATTGILSKRPHATTPTADLWAACSWSGTGWQCRCPTGSLAASDLPPGRAAFAVRFANQTTQSGVIRLEVNGCNSYDVGVARECLRYVEATVTASSRCQSTTCAMLALHSGAKGLPTAAITARQGVSGAALAVFNQDMNAAGVTVHTGGLYPGSWTLSSLPGTPPEQSKRDNDTALSGMDNDADGCLRCTFTSLFGLRPETYRRMMGTMVIDCAAVCSAADVNAALATTRGRVVWLTGAGGLTLDDPGNAIGTNADPVVLVIDGPFTIAAAASTGARVHGLVYTSAATLNGGEIRGALVSTTTVSGAGVGRVVYDGPLLRQLQRTAGTMVAIPGSWRDFP